MYRDTCVSRASSRAEQEGVAVSRAGNNQGSKASAVNWGEMHQTAHVHHCQHVLQQNPKMQHGRQRCKTTPGKSLQCHLKGLSSQHQVPGTPHSCPSRHNSLSPASQPLLPRIQEAPSENATIISQLCPSQDDSKGAASIHNRGLQPFQTLAAKFPQLQGEIYQAAHLQREPRSFCLLFFSPLSQAIPASFTWAVIPSIMETASRSVMWMTNRSLKRKKNQPKKGVESAIPKVAFQKSVLSSKWQSWMSGNGI